MAFPVDPDKLDALAQDVLSAAELALTDAGISIPSRSYVAPGEVAHDCDQLTVSLDSLFTGTPGRPISDPEHCGNARTAQFLVRLLRCYQTFEDESGEPPLVSDEEAKSTEILRDLWSLQQGILNRYHDGDFLDKCFSLQVGGSQRVGPGGGLVGFELTIQAQITGG